MPCLELHVDGIAQYVFCVWLLLLTLGLCDPVVTYEGCDFILMTFPAMLEKAMATHSGVLAWRIPGTAEPGGILTENLWDLTESDTAEATEQQQQH